MTCPQCQDRVTIYCYPQCKVWIDREGNVEDSDQLEGFTWDESSQAECTGCTWAGTVAELQEDEETTEEETD